MICIEKNEGTEGRNDQTFFFVKLYFEKDDGGCFLLTQIS